MSEETKKLPECFVIMPFTTPDGYEADHFNKIYEQLFKPAIERAGYKPHRVDEDNASNTIQSKIIRRLIDAPMVLCDLSTRNPNVLYELGMRHAFDKPVLLVQEKNTQRIFDISGIATVDYRGSRLYDEVIEDQNLIAKALKETAEARKSYSVLNTYKLDAAKVNHSGEMTSDDRISLQLAVITDSINSIGERLDRVEQSGLSKTAEIDAITRYKANEANRMLKQAVDQAQLIIERYREEEVLSASERMEMGKAKSNLQNAIKMAENYFNDDPKMDKYSMWARRTLMVLTELYRRSCMTSCNSDEK